MDKILKELYALDPELKKQDKLLRSVLKELMEARPVVSMDPAFYEQLRRQIRVRMKEDAGEFSVRTAVRGLGPWTFAFAGGFGLLAVAVVYFSLHSSPTGLQIATVGEEAYGPFVAEEPGKGGGGEPGEVLDFTFEYVGEPLTDYGSLDAYHSIPSLPEGLDLDLELPTVDVDSFGDFLPKSLELTPKNGDGYVLNYGYSGGLTLQEESPYTRARMEACNAGTCPPASYLSEDSLPTDEDLIAIVEDFWEDHVFSHELFGRPFVEESVVALQFEEGIEPFFTVVYPMILEGQPVYSLWGSVPEGVYVNVDALRQKVTGLYGYSVSPRFEKSAYPTLSSEQVLADAQNGGFGFQHWPEPTRIVTLQLGTPELVLSDYTTWVGGGSQTYYLPTLRFPILNDTEDLYRPDSILVPLVEITVN